jgi:uncharacterized membrane protein
VKNFTSDLSGKNFPENQRVEAKDVREAIVTKIKSEHPHFNDASCLSIQELNEFRRKYLAESLEHEIGTLSELEREVLNALHSNETISDDIDETMDEKLTLGQRIADRIAYFGGSWTFILSFFGFIFFWIVLNIYLLGSGSFDAYPFILLNLILSCLASLQAPVIMMSQNRQEEKDRIRSKHDYQVNLKAELEIRMLHEKVDHLILNQQQRLFEMQQMQLEMLEEITNRLPQK